MSDVIEFPIPERERKSARDVIIDEELKTIVDKKAREKIRFEILKTIDSYDGFFSEWNMTLPEDCSEALRKQIYDAAHQEYHRKMLMLRDIMRLKAKVLVAEYHQRK